MLLIVIMAGTTATVHFLCHDDNLIAFAESRIYLSEKARGDIYSYRGPFVDFEDRLLLDELESADYSSGGVYFFGSSNLKWAMMTWRLPAELPKLVHNYGIGAIDHADLREFIRHLVENENLLAAGPDKTHIVLGLTYDLAKARHGNSRRLYFPLLWNRRGVYRYDEVSGIQRIAQRPIHRFLCIEKARWAGFFRMMARLVRAEFRLWRHNDAIEVGLQTATKRHDPKTYQQLLRRFMGADSVWQAGMARQVIQLERTIDFLQSRGVRMTIVLMPRGSWDGNLPFATQYKRQIAKVCDNRSIPIVDLTSFLPDSCFADLAHPNPFGQEKLCEPLFDIALDALREMGTSGPSGMAHPHRSKPSMRPAAVGESAEDAESSERNDA